MQGSSFAPLIHRKPSGKWRQSFFYEHHYGPKIIPPCEGIRTERWAYIRWLPPNPESEELYDLKHDPLEQRNLAVDAKYSGILGQLRAQWQGAAVELK
jgi:arylsulfatase A-like enzyme